LLYSASELALRLDDRSVRSTNVKPLSVLLLSTLAIAQTTRTGNIITTDPTQPNVFASKISAPNVNAARVVDGTTYTTVQAAINALPATGGWVLVPPGIYAGPTRIPSNSRITGYVPGIPSATWNAASNFDAGTSPADRKVVFVYGSSLTLSNLWHTTIEGVTFDFRGTNNGLILANGVFDNDFDITIQNCGTAACLTLSSGNVIGQGVVLNHFRRLNIFNADKGIVCTGVAPGASGNNLFDWTVINNIATTAIELTQNCDTNSFDFTFIAGLADRASAIIFNNSDAPASNAGVESNVWRHLIVDAFEPRAYAGTILTFNQSRGTQIVSLEVGGSMSEPTYIATPHGSATYTVNFAGSLSNHAYDNLNIGHRNAFHGGALRAADFAISSGWGAAAGKAAISGTDMAGNMVVTSAGIGQSANPTVTLTFHDGAFPLYPFCIGVREDTAAPSTAHWATTSQSATGVTFTFVGIPQPGHNYGLMFHCAGWQ
jgi:hypothetical protein